MTLRGKIGRVLIGLLCGLVLFCWYRIQPKVLLESRGVRIVETPSSWDYAIFCRNYNPYYRFEYRTDGYLWAAVSFYGESFNARSVDIKWVSDSDAVVYLDEIPFFRFDGRERIWERVDMNTIAPK